MIMLKASDHHIKLLITRPEPTLDATYSAFGLAQPTQFLFKTLNLPIKASDEHIENF